MRQILLAGLKVVAVLGIALIVVAFSAGVLYALVNADRSENQDPGLFQASVRTSSEAVESEPLMRSDQGIRSPSPAAELTGSRPSEEATTSTTQSPALEPKSFDWAVDRTNAPSPTLEHDSAESDEQPLTVAEPLPKPALASPAGRKTSSALTPSTGVSPQSAAQGERANYYTVQEGDTLYGIAREVYGAGRHWKAIYEANQDLIDNARDLRLSWKLKIPPLENAGETN